jgi:hypothetical protein
MGARLDLPKAARAASSLLKGIGPALESESDYDSVHVRSQGDRQRPEEPEERHGVAERESARPAPLHTLALCRPFTAGTHVRHMPFRSATLHLSSCPRLSVPSKSGNVTKLMMTGAAQLQGTS